MSGEVLAPLFLLAVGLSIYVAARISHSRFMAGREAWLRRQAERAASAPAE